MVSGKLKIVLEGIAGAGVMGVMTIFSPLLRRWYRRWGTKDDEASRTLPGDEFVPHSKSQVTCVIEINAPVEHVWPWFLQLGCQRGGWYSYDLLDNGGAPSADRILPEFQHLEVGEIVKAVPNGSFGFPVAAILPFKALILAGTMDTRSGKPADPNDGRLEAYFSGDQTFYMESLGVGMTRLTYRMRTDWNATLLNNLVYGGILEPISFTMGRKMLLNIKRRAEILSSHSPG